MAITTVHLLLRKWDWRNARPHPSPLPQERGKHAQFPEFSRTLVEELLHGDSRRLLRCRRSTVPPVRSVSARRSDKRRFAG